MKNKNIIIIIGVVVVALVLLSPQMKIGKKLAGETSSRSFTRSSVYNNQEITITININPGTSTYFTVDEVVPVGWTVTSASNGGDYTTTARHIFWVELSASGPVSYTYTINPNNNLGVQTFTGTIGFQSKPEGPIGGTTSVIVVSCSASAETCNGIDTDCNYVRDNGVTQACGAGNCAGTETCQSSVCPDATTCQTPIGGTWGNCDTYNNDCGTCCICNTAGIRIYDAIQDGDCAATTCPSDNCGVDLCGSHIFGDYPATVANDCFSLDTCESNSCDGTATCSTDTDGDSYAGSNPAFTLCYDCNNNNEFMYYTYPAGEVCGDGYDNDCTGTSEIYFNDADWGTPNGFCNVANGLCCDGDITMNELLDAIGQWKAAQFVMDDLLDSIGAWKT